MIELMIKWLTKTIVLYIKTKILFDSLIHLA